MKHNQPAAQGIGTPPLSRFPLRGKAGAGGFPPRRKHATGQPKTLARIDAAGSPPRGATAPLWIPRPELESALSGEGFV